MTDSKTVEGWRGVFRRAWFRVFPPTSKYPKRQGWYW